MDLLTAETLSKAQEDKSTIISQSNYSRSLPKLPQRRESSSSASSDDDEFEQLQQARDTYYKTRMKFTPQSTLVEKKLQQVSLPDSVRTENTTVDFVLACLYEWLTDKTRMSLRNHPTASPSSIDPLKYQQFVNRLDVEDLMASEGSRPEKKLPTIDELRKTSEDQQYELKVKEFYFGKETPIKEVNIH